MKAQGLPMTTIVLIILVIVVLAGVAIFFFTQMTTGGASTGQQQKFAACQSACLRMQQQGLACGDTATAGTYKKFDANPPKGDYVNCCGYDKCVAVTCC